MQRLTFLQFSKNRDHRWSAEPTHPLGSRRRERQTTPDRDRMSTLLSVPLAHDRHFLFSPSSPMVSSPQPPANPARSSFFPLFSTADPRQRRCGRSSPDTTHAMRRTTALPTGAQLHATP
jgi:hypothetical protein